VQPLETGMVEIHRLRRVFARRRAEPRVALDDLDLVIDKGEVHGLLGPNGAGKTTLCKILATVLLPTSGTARVDGRDVVTDTAAVRRKIGIVFGGERGLYTRLTARENLMYWSALYLQRTRDGARRVTELLDRVGLADRAGERVETFSRGMKQRLHLARGLIGDPRMLVLDEPTIGMDPVAARDFRLLVGELRAEGRTILLTTHDMAEAESVCDRVSLIDNGRMLATENPRTIGQWLLTYERVVASSVDPETAARLRGVAGVANVDYRADDAAVTVETNAEGAANAVLRILADAGVSDVSTARPNLSEVYLRLIGNRGLQV
jgi:ABC-2 type transport system ATP-binding protein